MVTAVAFVALIVAVLAFFAQIGAGTRLQERVTVLEMKIRCAELLPASHEVEFRKLTPKQIVALSSASDDQLGRLLDRAAREQLTPELILKAIQ